MPDYGMIPSDRAKHMPMIAPQYRTVIPGATIPHAEVVYTVGGGLIPALPADPDLPRALTATTVHGGKNRRLANGLTRRADIMARLMARGAGTSAAYRAAYNGYDHDPIRVSDRANKITQHAAFSSVVSRYRATLEHEARQQAIGLGDFVKSRLVHEAQRARNDGARIRALELLGKTEGMFMDVRRTEKALSPKDLGALKSELNQRLRDHLLRVAPQLAAIGLSQDTGTDTPSTGDDGPQSSHGDPHRGAPPLNSSRDSPSSEDSIPGTQSRRSYDPPVQPPIFQTTPHGSPNLEHPRVGSPSLSSPVDNSRVRVIILGAEHREMSINDL